MPKLSFFLKRHQKVNWGPYPKSLVPEVQALDYFKF